ncbi:40 kDa farnesylated protein associated with peroxisomes [Ceraceosorus bombacis]|uniref:40 kDa farnesylated protein associated with peroxisomes n=1 Tax=Ceraceosorus bombacis TaxID=401625 RepID=A0A0P1BQB3_9BASI|nr:40 kDa farnesylated protein associated with peroxisomes [Ceraceosorus bombacis]
MTEEKRPPASADAADDLDDLDDVLDDFNQGSSAAASASGPQPSSSAPQPAAAPSTTASDAKPSGDDSEAGAEENDDDIFEGDFAKELAQGMEALMRELGGAGPGAGGTDTQSGQLPAGASGPVPPPGADGAQPQYSEEEMMKQFEAMMQEMGLGGPPDGAPAASGAGGAGSTSTGGAAGPPPANFQDAIRQTMDRLKNSDTSASSATGAGGGLGGMGEADLEKLMAALSGGEGGEGGADFEKMMESMMAELMSKDVLYEPLKELRDKYPEYLNSPAAASISASDRSRYQAQARIVSQVVSTFEDPAYTNGTEDQKKHLRATVGELMNEMQDNGSPPDEIVGDIPPELANMPGMGGGDEQCSVM